MATTNTRRLGFGAPWAGFETCESRTLFAFGVTTSGTNFVIDNGGSVVFSVSKTNADVTSLKYNGTEVLASYGTTSRYSHYASGLSSTATTVTTQVDSTNGWIKVTATDSGLGVTQYYIARRGYSNVYMATYTGSSTPPTPGEMRFIYYLDRTKFNVNVPSDTQGRTVIEGGDVFADTATGNTFSKFYSARRNIDDPYHGVTGPGIGAFMMIGSREKGAGGPFFKDIAMQGGASEELYNYMYSGHTQTEAFRAGLQGPYALQLTNGSAPAAVDYSFMDGLGISGWLSASGRGRFAGTVVGGPSGYTLTVGVANGTAQYWGSVNASGGFSIAGIRPGTYTATVYAGELAVGTQSITVSANAVTNTNLHPGGVPGGAIWTIGTWDGTPAGFRNASQLNTQHPSDSRMSAWSNANYTVGSSATSVWPTAQWKDVNNSNRIAFTLTSAQATAGVTLRVGITDAFGGGRPAITVNAGQSYAWTSALPSATTQPDGRSITRGTYRGNNYTFSYTIPPSSLRTGSNTITLAVNSGTSGEDYLSPVIVYDAIDLIPTAAARPAAKTAPLTVAPAARATGSTASPFAAGPTIGQALLATDDKEEAGDPLP